jgi:glucokinase
MILAGDIGGTNTRLALFNGDPRVPERLRVYRSSEHAGLDELLELFLADCDVAVEAASFGVAAPIRAGRATGVNLPWAVYGPELASLLGLRSVGLLNDLEANAHGIAALSEDDIVVLNEGAADASGNAALISAGTGLGQAGLYWDGRSYRPFATEGGHADFGPGDEVQAALLLYLRKKHGHVSYERICSGSGLVDVHAFLCDFTGEPPEEWLADQLDRPGAAAAICRAALDYRSATCARAVRLFVSVYGAQAGNLALAVGATGGVYLGGGIAPKVLPFLRHGGFMAAFLDKGRFASLLARIPVRVILDDKAALLGAARHAVSGGVA